MRTNIRARSAQDKVRNYSASCRTRPPARVRQRFVLFFGFFFPNANLRKINKLFLSGLNGLDNNLQGYQCMQYEVTCQSEPLMVTWQSVHLPLYAMQTLCT